MVHPLATTRFHMFDLDVLLYLFVVLPVVNMVVVGSATAYLHPQPPLTTMNHSRRNVRRTVKSSNHHHHHHHRGVQLLLMATRGKPSTRSTTTVCINDGPSPHRTMTISNDDDKNSHHNYHRDFVMTIENQRPQHPSPPPKIRTATTTTTTTTVMGRQSCVQTLMIMGLSYCCVGTSSSQASTAAENVNELSITTTVPTTTTTTTQPTTATPQQPYATSVMALIPAIRVRDMIDQAIAVTKRLQSLRAMEPPTDNTVQQQLQQQHEAEALLLFQLQQLLLQKQNFTTVSITDSSSSSSSRRRTTTNTNGSVAKSYQDLYNTRRRQLQNTGGDWWQLPGAILVQRGEITTFQQLQQQEQQREANDEIRAALNFYMNQLQYSTQQYTLTVPIETRKQMIRTETLPDVLRQVVPSDMDLRTLYRNDVLTALQDARAELQYQLGLIVVSTQQHAESSRELVFDGQELLLLLQQGQQALQQWFQMIDINEIQMAEQQLRLLQQQQQESM